MNVVQRSSWPFHLVALDSHKNPFIVLWGKKKKNTVYGGLIWPVRRVSLSASCSLEVYANLGYWTNAWRHLMSPAIHRTDVHGIY